MKFTSLSLNEPALVPAKSGFTPVSLEDEAPKGGMKFTKIETDPESDLGSAFKRGVEVSLNPFGADEKEHSQKRTGAETAVEVAANIGTDILTTIAASAGAGALAGSVVPGAGTAVGAAVGTATGLGLGIYRALGYEDLQSRIKGEAFNFGRAAVNVATEVNPLLKFGGKAAKAGTQGVLQALQTLSYGGTGVEAGIAGVIGGGAGALAHRAGEPRAALTPGQKEAQIAEVAASLADRTLGPRGVQTLVETMGENDTSMKIAIGAFDRAKSMEKTETAFAKIFTQDSIFDDLQNPAKLDTMFDSIDNHDLQLSPERMKQARRMVKQQLKDDGIVGADKAMIAEHVPKMARQLEMEDEAAGFARFITKKPGERIGPELFQEAKEQIGKSSWSTAGLYTLYRKTVHENAVAVKMATQAAEEGTGLKDPLGMAVFRFFSDLKYAARAIDRSTGLNIEGITDAVSHKKNLHGVFMHGITAKTNKYLKQAKKAGLDRGEISKMLEQGQDKTTDGEVGDILKGFRGLFDEIAAFADHNNLKIDKIDNYVTRLSQDPASLITSLRRRAMTYSNGKALINPEALQDTDLHKVLEHVTGIAIKGEDSEMLVQIQRAMNKLQTVHTLKTKEGFESIGSFQRKGEIPEFAREMDIGKIMIRYANNTSKSVYMEPIIKELQTQVPVLETLGYNSSVKYLQNYIKNISGQPSEVVAWMNASKVRWQSSMDELIDTKELTGLGKLGADAAKSMPDFLSWSLSLIYPNYLGLSAKATLRNYLQPTMMTAPELQGVYGQKLVMRGWMETLRDKKTGVHLEKFLEDRGHLPGQHIGEGMNEAASALRGTALGPAIAKIDKFNEKLMYFYSKSDVINRYVTLKTAKQVTKDALEGMSSAKPTRDQAAAAKFFAELSPGIKSSVYKLAKEGRVEQIEDVIGRYLISKTQFNYGPQAASEYARTMGRLFSMFTKWPAMIAGDVHELAVTGQFRKAAERYLAPWAALGALQLWLNDSKDSPRKRALMGRSLLDISPASSLTGATIPPFMDIGGGVYKSFMDAASFDFEGAGNNMANSLKAILPIGPAALRIGDDINAIWSNKKKSSWRE